MVESVSQAEPLAPTRQPRTRWRRLAVVAAVFLGFALALNAFLYWGKTPRLAAPVRFEIPVPAGSLNFALSPDGRRACFLAPGPDGRRLIWIRALDSLETRPLPGTENVYGPHAFWSPDSRFVAISVGKQVETDRYLRWPTADDLRYLWASVLGGAWNKDDIIFLAPTAKESCKFRPGAVFLPFLRLRAGATRFTLFLFFSLSDGRHFVYLRAPENSGIYIGSLDAKPEQQSSKRILATSLNGGLCAFLRRRIGTTVFYRAMAPCWLRCSKSGDWS